MINLDDIIRKVQALLNVEGRSPEEAAAYVAKAQAMLAKYDLSMETIANLKADKRTSVRKAEKSDASVTEGKPESWKADILQAVADAFDCRVIFDHAIERTKSGRYRSIRHGYLVGFGHDVEAAGYANAFVVAEITRLAKEYARAGWDTIRNRAALYGISVHDAERDYVDMTGTHPLKMEISFIKGAAETATEVISREAREMRRRAREANPNALVIQKREEVDDEYERLRWGMTPEQWAARKAKQAEREAAGGVGDLSAYLAQRRREYEAEQAKHAAETPAQHAKCERAAARKAAAEAREYAKWERKEARRAQAEANRAARAAERLDWHAVRDGRAAGSALSIRPGIKQS